MIRFKSFATTLWAALTLLAVVSCASSGSSLGGTWRLAGWTLNSLDPSRFQITARFEDGTISGSSGVNTYSGRYKLGPANSFSVQDISSTEMAGPEAAMRAEAAYTELLSQARSYNDTVGALILYDQNGNESLRFEPTGK